MPSSARRTGIESGDEERKNVSRSGAFGRQSRMKAQAGQPWIHAFAATDVAARAVVIIHVSRNAINTVLQQSV